jgi:hypothetical protein
MHNCERSEAIQSVSKAAAWIASSQGLLAMTVVCGSGGELHPFPR